MPLPTLTMPPEPIFPIIPTETLQPTLSRFERSDTCAVPAAGVVAEAVVAPVIANALLEKLGGDHLDEIQKRLTLYRENIRNTFFA